MIEIPHLEWHAAHACNFTCESCAHFSNHHINEIIPLKTLEKWYMPWVKRIIPERMAILGGEPLLNKEIIDIIYMTREMWSKKNYYFELVTNGWLLHKYPNLPKVLEETNCVLMISVHGKSEEYTKKLDEIKNILSAWKNNYNIDVRFSNMGNTIGSFPFHWNRIYKGFGDRLEPYEDNNYKKSWDNCATGQECFQLFNEKLFKCSMLAYLPTLKNKYNISSKWDKYLNYKPLEPSCSDQDIIDFFNRKAEVYCGMCPSNPEIFEKADPLIPIKFYKNKKLFEEINFTY